MAHKHEVDVKTISPGDGENYPKDKQTVVVHYVGRLTDGKQFDSSRDRGNPFTFRVDNDEVIKGWDDGIKKMSKGEKAVLTCPPDLGYGKLGYPGVIPPNSTLIFEIELLDIQ